MSPASYVPNGRVATYHDNTCHGEDAFVSVEMAPDIALDAVLDGATGRGGQYASRTAAEALQNGAIGDPSALLVSVETINRVLFQRGKGRFFLTTLSVALKVHETLHVVSVGDSPILLLRRNDLMPLTAAATRAPAAGRMPALLGRHDKLSYEATRVDLQESDRLILATDGVSDHLGVAPLAELVRQAATPDAAVTALREILRHKQRGHRYAIDTLRTWTADDATAVIRYFGDSGKTVTHAPAAES
jgi:serine/threonine protein phosphatase PrpC